MGIFAILVIQLFDVLFISTKTSGIEIKIH